MHRLNVVLEIAVLKINLAYSYTATNIFTRAFNSMTTLSYQDNRACAINFLGNKVVSSVIFGTAVSF